MGSLSGLSGLSGLSALFGGVTLPSQINSYISPASVVSYSSQSGSYVATNSIDGVWGSQWRTLNQPFHWIEYDLGGLYMVHGIRRYITSTAGIEIHLCATVYVAQNYGDWGSYVGYVANWSGAAGALLVINTTPKVGRYLRYTFWATTACNSGSSATKNLFEFWVYV